MSKKIELLKELYLKNKLSHAILIETNNQNFCIDEIIELSKIMSCEDYFNEEHDSNCPLCNMIEKRESLNMFLIEPEGKNIKKEQMIELRNKCSKMPIISKNNIYIVKNTEKFNNSSANAMLKFIEEPYDNCFGFFVTNNKDNVINTIRSRCEIYCIKYENNNIIDSNEINDDELILIKENLNIYLNEIRDKKSIIVNKEVLLETYKDKDNVMKFFSVMYDVFNTYIHLSLEDNYINKYNEFNLLKDQNLSSLINKQQLIVTILNNMSYNLNIDLIFDKFVIEMGEIDEKFICS